MKIFQYSHDDSQNIDNYMTIFFRTFELLLFAVAVALASRGALGAAAERSRRQERDTAGLQALQARLE